MRRRYASQPILVFLFSIVSVAYAQTSRDPKSPPPSNTPIAEIRLIVQTEDPQSKAPLKLDELHLFEDNQERKLVSLEGGADSPLMLGLLFDASGSRRYDRYVGEERRQAADLLRNTWRQGSSAFVVAFNDSSDVITKPTRQLPEVIEGLDRLSEIHPRGSTALYDAICIFDPDKIARVAGRKVFLVFSDFGDNSSVDSLKKMLACTSTAGVQVFPILLGPDFTMGPPDKKHLAIGRRTAQEVADETGGKLFGPESHKDLPFIFEKIRLALENSYRVQYIEPNSPEKSKKKLSLSLDRPGSIATHSMGYLRAEH